MTIPTCSHNKYYTISHNTLTVLLYLQVQVIELKKIMNFYEQTNLKFFLFSQYLNALKIKMLGNNFW